MVSVCEGVRKLVIREPNEIIKEIKEFVPDKGIVGIYFEDEAKFLEIQELYVQHFGSQNQLEILRCMKNLKNIKNIEKAIKLIEKKHKERNHRGINEIYLEIKMNGFSKNKRNYKKIHK